MMMTTMGPENIPAIRETLSLSFSLISIVSFDGVGLIDFGAVGSTDFDSH